MIDLSFRVSEKMNRNVTRAFPLDQPQRRREDIVDCNTCVICQDIPKKGLMNIKLAPYLFIYLFIY